MRRTAQEMAARVARDIPDGSYVNLGIGLPTLVADVAPPDREIIYHSENGILGMGPAPEPGTGDPELINAGKQPVTLLPGGAYFHHTDAFVMMRGGHIDITVLGAFQVAANGDLANWATDDATLPPAVGGAMDLAVGARRVFVLTTHTTKDGRPKLLPACTYPLTAAAVVDRVYTDLAVIDVTPDGFVVREMVHGLTRNELQAKTAAPLRFGDRS
ncbi:3-oxoacid CoA-transferase subunit B [Pseudonocardia sp. DSM 110487]|uniref:3-oxoacid CoA-transferase subunit B n=1 Tax=Pseudonocardia sp. DSM 110487 TaxID=2865833 RepID=UPI001C69EA65|nr:3-oxoacid CoA-transferase subunit B [Pseudonocardia sp. DSM 110487]QYN36041.1 3-oxoacid CoA-transferase subunit B [Pseudonocardia sp. DSM 110487]